MKILTRWAPAALAAGALMLGTAATASASTQAPHTPSYHAVTRMIDRPDGGYAPAPAGGDTWANDYFTRTLTLTPQGQGNCAAGQFQFTARLDDSWGRFVTVPGAYTPNQAGAYAGQKIHGVVRGEMRGYGTFGPFCASAQPDLSLVPRSEVGAVHPSSTWPELAFPSGTTFSGVNEATYAYSYSAAVWHLVRVPVFWHHHFWGFRWVWRVSHQRWNETSSNGDGDQAGDGNILG